MGYENRRRYPPSCSTRATALRMCSRRPVSSAEKGSSSSMRRGLRREGSRQCHALLLAAGKLVGTARQPCCGRARPYPVSSTIRLSRSGAPSARNRSRYCRQRSDAGRAHRPARRCRCRACAPGTAAEPSGKRFAVQDDLPFIGPSRSRRRCAANVVLPEPEGPTIGGATAGGNVQRHLVQRCH